MKKIIILTLASLYSAAIFSNTINDNFLPSSYARTPNYIDFIILSGPSAEYEICIDDCEADCYDELVEALYIDSISIFSPLEIVRYNDYDQCILQCEDSCAYLE